MNKYPASMANHLSAYGRYGDDQLVHMNGQEVAALDGIAAAFGRELTRNPHTGMKEAFNLFDILPIALSFTGIGAPAAIALSAASGAASAAVEGNDPLQGALMGGISGALGASFGGGADAATKAGADATTKAAADVGKVTLAGTPVAGPLGPGLTGAPTEAALAEALNKPLIGAGGEVAGQLASPPPGMFGDTFTDIFGPGTDKEVGDALQSIWKKENMPYTFMGMQALSSLPDMFGGDSGPGRPEYKDIPENFPGAPRVVNPDYDPTMSAFGEQNAFSSGVNYGLPPLGYSNGGSVFTRAGRMPPQGKGPGGKNGQQPGEMPPPPPRQRNIVPTDMSRMYAGSSPLFMSAPYTQIPLPGGQMGAPVGGGFSGMYQPDRSFEIATPPQGGPQQYNMPMSGGGMGQPQAGGKAGGSPKGGRMVAPKEAEVPQINPGGMEPQGYAMGGQVKPKRKIKSLNDLAESLKSSPKKNSPPQPSDYTDTMGPLGALIAVPDIIGSGIASYMRPKPQTELERMIAAQRAREAAKKQGGYAVGGMVDRAMEMDDRTVVKEAMAAIMGQSPNPEAAIAMFVDRFGEEALQMLMQKAQGGQQGRYIEGPGDGLSDSIPAVVDGQQPSALSTGEFVIPADAVSHLGNGDNKTGAKELYGMIDRLRQARTGSPTPPPAINQRGIMPA